MAYKVTNNAAGAYVIPPDYGGGSLAGGANITIGDDLSFINDNFAAANPGVSTDPLQFDYVPNNAQTILPGAFTALSQGQWAGAPPATLRDAVNRLATAVVALRGGSAIP